MALVLQLQTAQTHNCQLCCAIIGLFYTKLFSRRFTWIESCTFFSQRISISILRGKAASLLGLFPVDSGADEFLNTLLFYSSFFDTYL